jgi:hypothetical protein
MAKNEVPIKVNIEIQGKKYGAILTHDMDGLSFSPEPALKAGTEVGRLVSRTIFQHFVPEAGDARL